MQINFTTKKIWRTVLIYPINQILIIVWRTLMKEGNVDGGWKKQVVQTYRKNYRQTRVSITSEINNDKARKDGSHTTKYINNSTKQYNNEKKEKHQTENKNDKKEKSVIILGGSMVKHINGWDISKRLTWCKVCVKDLSIAKTQYMKDYLKLSLCQNLSNLI